MVWLMTISISVAPVSNSVNTGTTVSVTLNGCTAGNAIIYGYSLGNNGTYHTGGVSATGESNGTDIVFFGPTTGTNGPVTHLIGYFQNIVSGGSKTVTATLFSGTINSAYLWAMEISGGNKTALLDSHNETAPASTTTPTHTLTTSASNCIIVAQTAG